MAVIWIIPLLRGFESRLEKNCVSRFGRRRRSRRTEMRCPHYVRLSLNRRHDVAAPRTTLRARSRLWSTAELR
jgi:hypothetical protein